MLLKDSLQSTICRFLFLLTFTQSLAANANDQSVRYKNEAELAGGALSTLLLNPKLVSGVLNACSTLSIDLAAVQTETISAWTRRNRSYLELLDGFKEQLDESAKHEGVADAFALVENHVRRNTEHALDTFSKNLSGQAKETKLQTCIGVVEEINAGKQRKNKPF